MSKQENFFKYLSVFLLGVILGFSIAKMPLYSQSTSTITSEGSVKVLGNDNAPVTITEYSDFQCPLCKLFYDNSFPTIKKYVDAGQVKIVYKHFPLNIHPQAPAASLASECALEQNKFWEMHDALFQQQEGWSFKDDHLETFKKIAADLKLDTAKFDTCLTAKTYTGNVDKDYQEGLTKGISGTPTFYVNDQIIVGAQDTSVFTAAIEAQLKK